MEVKYYICICILLRKLHQNLFCKNKMPIKREKASENYTLKVQQQK